MRFKKMILMRLVALTRYHCTKPSRIMQTSGLATGKASSTCGTPIPATSGIQIGALHDIFLRYQKGNSCTTCARYVQYIKRHVRIPRNIWHPWVIWHHNFGKPWRYCLSMACCISNKARFVSLILPGSECNISYRILDKYMSYQKEGYRKRCIFPSE